MRAFAAFIVASLCCGYAFAQITDPAQRKDWFYLQTLSTQFEEFRQCLPDYENKIEWDKYWRTYNMKEGELAAEIESYVKKFVERRGENESPDGFKYRVWDVTLSVGKEKARKMNSTECIAVRVLQ